MADDMMEGMEGKDGRKEQRQNPQTLTVVEILWLAENIGCRSEDIAEKLPLENFIDCIRTCDPPDTSPRLGEIIPVPAKCEESDKGATADVSEAEDGEKEKKKLELTENLQEKAVAHLVDVVITHVLLLSKDLAAARGFIIQFIPEALQNLPEANITYKTRWNREDLLTELKGFMSILDELLVIREGLSTIPGVKEKLDAITALLEDVGPFVTGTLDEFSESEGGNKESVKLQNYFEQAPANIVENLQPGFNDAIMEMLEKNDGNSWNLDELYQLENAGDFLGRPEFMQRMIQRVKAASEIVDIRVITTYLRIMRTIFDKLSRDDRRLVMTEFYSTVGRYDKELKGFGEEFFGLLKRAVEEDSRGEEEKRKGTTEEMAWFLMLKLKGKGSILFHLLKDAVEQQGFVTTVVKVLTELSPVSNWTDPGKDVPVFVEAIHYLVESKITQYNRAYVARLVDLLIGISHTIGAMLILEKIVLSGIEKDKNPCVYLECLIALLNEDLPLVWSGTKKGADEAWEGKPPEEDSETQEGSVNVAKLLGDLADLTKKTEWGVTAAAKVAIESLVKEVERKQVPLEDAALEYIEGLDEVSAVLKFKMMVASGRKPPVQECLYKAMSDEKKEDHRSVKCPEEHGSDLGANLRCIFQSVFTLAFLDEERAFAIMSDGFRYDCHYEGGRDVLVKEVVQILGEKPEHMNLIYRIIRQLQLQRERGRCVLLNKWRRAVSEELWEWEELLVLGEAVACIATSEAVERYAGLVTEQLKTESSEEAGIEQKIRANVELSAMIFTCRRMAESLEGNEVKKLEEAEKELVEKLRHTDESLGLGSRVEIFEVEDRHAVPVVISEHEERGSAVEQVEGDAGMDAETQTEAPTDLDHTVPSFEDKFVLQEPISSAESIPLNIPSDPGKVEASEHSARYTVLNPDAEAYDPLKRPASQSPPAQKGVTEEYKVQNFTAVGSSGFGAAYGQPAEIGTSRNEMENQPVTGRDAHPLPQLPWDGRGLSSGGGRHGEADQDTAPAGNVNVGYAGFGASWTTNVGGVGRGQPIVQQSQDGFTLRGPGSLSPGMSDDVRMGHGHDDWRKPDGDQKFGGRSSGFSGRRGGENRYGSRDGKMPWRDDRYVSSGDRVHAGGNYSEVRRGGAGGIRGGFRGGAGGGFTGQGFQGHRGARGGFDGHVREESDRGGFTGAGFHRGDGGRRFSNQRRGDGNDKEEKYSREKGKKDRKSRDRE